MQPTVLHVVHSLEGGGTERTLANLLRAMPPGGVRHVLVTLRAAGSLCEVLPDHVAVYPLQRLGRSWSAGFEIARVARSYGTGIIHARNTGCWSDALVAGALIRGVRTVLSFHGLEAGGSFTSRQKLLARWGRRLGADFTTVWEAGREQLHTEAHIPRHRIELLRNGVDLDRYRHVGNDARRIVRESLGFADNSFVVGSVGSLTTVKRHDLLIQAFACLVRAVPRARLLLVGDGPCRDSLTRQAQSSGLLSRIRFVGRRQDVPDLLGAMNAYVCCSDAEGISNSLLEAMACGVPVVTTPVGDHAIIVRREVDGLVIPCQSAELLTAALVRLARSSSRRRRFAWAAEARAHDFSFETTVRAYETFYSTRLSATQRPVAPSSHQSKPFLAEVQ